MMMLVMMMKMKKKMMMMMAKTKSDNYSLKYFEHMLPTSDQNRPSKKEMTTQKKSKVNKKPQGVALKREKENLAMMKTKVK